MKRAILCLLALVLLCVSFAVPAGAEEETGDPEEYDYAVWLLPDGCTRETCPPVDDAWMTDDEDMLLLMTALREWYPREYEWEPMYLDGRYMLLVNPFIFQIDENEQDKTIYCMSYFYTFYMYSDPEGKKTLVTEYDSCLPLAVLFKQEDGQWILSSVTCPGPEEELVPGWGIGTDGINGISDEMFLMMDEGNHFERNKEYMNRYLEHNHLENAEVNWGR